MRLWSSLKRIPVSALFVWMSCICRIKSALSKANSMQICSDQIKMSWPWNGEMVSPFQEMGDRNDAEHGERAAFTHLE